MNNILSKRFMNMNQFTVQGQQIRPVIERGASWSYNETRILLSLWGQDMIQRQLTNSKRTRHVWEKIAERIKEHGFDRTADQVRTRVFNMIAEYRRILKNPTPEKKKKCAFFDALQKIYQAKDTNGVKAALDNYEEEYHFDPIEFNNLDDDLMNDNENGLENSENSENEDKEIFSYALSPSDFKSYNFNNQNGFNGNSSSKDINNNHSLNSSTSNGFSNHNNFLYAYSNYINSQQNSQNNSIDNGEVSDNHSEDNNILNENGSTKKTKYNDNFNLNFKKKKKFYDAEFSSDKYNSQNELNFQSAAILIERMFNHLTKETEVMREWIKLERERLQQEMIRRREESCREERREKKFLETLVKMQEQMFNFLSKNSLSNSNSISDSNPSLNLNLNRNVNQNSTLTTTSTTNSISSPTFICSFSTPNSTSTFTSTFTSNSTSSNTTSNPTFIPTSTSISSNLKKNITTNNSSIVLNSSLTENFNNSRTYQLPFITQNETSGHNCLSLKYNQNIKNDDAPNNLEYVIEEQVVEDEEPEINYSYSNVQYEEIVD